MIQFLSLVRRCLTLTDVRRNFLRLGLLICKSETFNGCLLPLASKLLPVGLDVEVEVLHKLNVVHEELLAEGALECHVGLELLIQNLDVALKQELVQIYPVT